MARPGKATTQEIALAINQLMGLLQKEYLYDFTLKISAQGDVIASSSSVNLGPVFPVEGGGRDASVYF